jgi:hypothetical protein
MDVQKIIKRDRVVLEIENDNYLRIKFERYS